MTIRLVISPRQVGSVASESRWSGGIRKLFNGLDKPYPAVLEWVGSSGGQIASPMGREPACVRRTVPGRTRSDGASSKGISDRPGIGMCRGLRDRRDSDGSVLRAPWFSDVRV